MFRIMMPANAIVGRIIFLGEIVTAEVLLTSGPLLNGLTHVVTCMIVLPRPLKDVPGVHVLTHLPETLTEADSKSVTTTC